ncbi:MAG TPA: response regulator transcription factor [Gammaproteobacteria bacterium]|nr:response regulator transcription factor [Gammaproteobacteria bacterium]
MHPLTGPAHTPFPASRPEGAPVRVLLADDHKIFRQSLSMLLQQEGFEVAGEAADGPEALDLAETRHPDVAILDYDMPAMDGISVARELQRSTPGIQTVLLTTDEDNASAVEALRAGMHGYVYKSQTGAELISTIREVARGAIHFNTRLTPGALSSLVSHAETPPEPLTEREREVLLLIARGNTTRMIAKELGLSVKTVESHRSRIMHKLHVHRAAELIRYAIRRQLIPP